MKYKAYSLANLKKIPQLKKALPPKKLFEIEAVSNVLPFKTNNYVVNELINWRDVPNDPIYILNFPQRNMLLKSHYNKMAQAVRRGDSKKAIIEIANRIRFELNPHSSGQWEYNRPKVNGQYLRGVQHKYRETVLFFPSEGQTCHAYCTFCFRWPQFVELPEMRFAMSEVEKLVAYVKEHKEITDILFTGGDPMMMHVKLLSSYITPILEAKIPHLTTIRIGTKVLGYWPYRFLSDADSDDILRLFEKIVRDGYHLAFMAHFTHPRELQTKALQKAVERVQSTGAVVRTQAPIMKHINDDAAIWETMWREQVNLGMIPYYMFVARDTGAQHYFALPLDKTLAVYNKAFQSLSGLARTARGPIMSTTPGKIIIEGINVVDREKVFTLKFLQSREPRWCARPFFAKYSPTAQWISDLKPAFGEQKFFFE